ncbi:MAG: diguanylate cyclase [Paracoccaceae bacterium]
MSDRALEDEVGRLAAIERMGGTIRASKRLRLLAEFAQEALRVPLVALTLVDEGRQRVCLSARGPLGDGPREAAFCDRTIRGREVLVVPDAAMDLRFADSPYVTGPPGIRAYLGAPLTTAEGYNLGALCAIDRRPRAFGRAEAALLASLARRSIEEIARDAPQRDPLTGALSDAAWTAAAAAEIARVRQEPEPRPATLLLCQARGIGEANVAYGRSAGDAGLIATAAALARVAGPDGCVGRVGGTRFAAVLPGRDADAAATLGEAARAGVAAAHTGLTPPGLLGASFGAAELAPAIDGPDLWLTAADVALSAGREGRRRRCGVV